MVVGKMGMLMMMMMVSITIVAADPDALQDVCVADLNSTKSKISSKHSNLFVFILVKVNGFVCKAGFNATDFFSDVLAKPGLTNNTNGAVVTLANVMKIPGLNTLGVSLARIDYAPGGINPPHTHPRATEIVYVLQGELYVGFITTANVLVSTTIKQGEVFVFPKGLVHFQINNGYIPAAVIAGFNSQLQGTVTIATTLFGATPPVPDNVLEKGFQIDTADVVKIKAKFAPKP